MISNAAEVSLLCLIRLTQSSDAWLFTELEMIVSCSEEPRSVFPSQKLSHARSSAEARVQQRMLIMR